MCDVYADMVLESVCDVDIDMMLERVMLMLT